jgi:hypothetical protein
MEEIERQDGPRDFQIDKKNRFLKTIRLENLRFTLRLTTNKKTLLNDEQKLSFLIIV